MIWASGPWKLELIRMVNRCERQYTQMGLMRHESWWDAAVRAQQIEKAVFVGAFIIRKLIDSEQLSVQAEDCRVTLKTYPLKVPGVVPDSLTWDKLDRYYDLDSPDEEHVPLRHLTNWIIHSFVFIPETRSDLAGSEVIIGFYFNSDRIRSSRVMRLSWWDYRQMLQEVATDDVVEILQIRDTQGASVQLRSNARVSEAERDAFYTKHAAFIQEVARAVPEV